MTLTHTSRSVQLKCDSGHEFFVIKEIEQGDCVAVTNLHYEGIEQGAALVLSFKCVHANPNVGGQAFSESLLNLLSVVVEVHEFIIDNRA
jgi:hypothetical protein